MKLTRIRLGAALAAAAMAVAGSMTALASPAYAAEEDPGEGGHCVANTQETIERCFATYEEAKAYVSSVAEILPDKPNGGTQGFNVEAPRVVPLGGLVLIFIGFDWQFFNPLGGSLWVIGLSGPCSLSFADVDYQLRSLPARWNNDISSYLDFSICWTRLYDGVGFTGAFRGYTPDSATLGGFNNRASSIRWT